MPAIPTAPDPTAADLAGRTALVTGANSGIGLETARALARRGARVLIGARDRGKGERAVTDLRATVADADVALLVVDLADLAAVEAASDELHERTDRLDLLVNNAGVMAPPYRRTPDGFELQLGTNHLGHFALTGRVVDLLLAADAPRVVTVSSNVARGGRIDFDNLDGARGYRKWRAYAQSKLANLLFAVELQRRAEAAGMPLLSVAAHPGWAATNLQVAGPRLSGARAAEVLSSLGNRLFAQDATAGAAPTVRAATGDDVRAGDYWGPGGLGGLRGAPTRVPMPPAAHDVTTARRLWEVSEELTGIGLPVGPRV